MADERGVPGSPGGRSSNKPGNSGGTPKRESYYSLDTDDMLRIDRRKIPRPQAVWVDADALAPQFADHVQLSRVESHYHLTFGQSHVPITKDSGTAPVNEIRPIARMIIPQDVIRRMITLIEQNSPGLEGGD
jgi:hypothetical protein